MRTKPLVIAIAAVAPLSAGLDVVITPALDAALGNESPGDLLAPLVTPGATANDGRVWSAVGC